MSSITIKVIYWKSFFPFEVELWCCHMELMLWETPSKRDRCLKHVYQTCQFNLLTTDIDVTSEAPVSIKWVLTPWCSVWFPFLGNWGYICNLDIIYLITIVSQNSSTFVEWTNPVSEAKSLNIENVIVHIIFI